MFSMPRATSEMRAVEEENSTITLLVAEPTCGSTGCEIKKVKAGVRQELEAQTDQRFGQHLPYESPGHQCTLHFAYTHALGKGFFPILLLAAGARQLLLPLQLHEPHYPRVTPYAGIPVAALPAPVARAQ